jgi:hypothetical protein
LNFFSNVRYKNNHYFGKCQLRFVSKFKLFCKQICSWWNLFNYFIYYKIRAWALLDHLYKIKYFLADSLITRKYWNNKLICIQNRCWKEAFSFRALITVEFFDRPKGDYHELIRLAEIVKEIFQEKKLRGISNFLSRKLRKLHFTENSADVIHRLFKCFEFEWRHK